MKIAVLMGGTSAERDVSLASGRAVVGALRERGHAVAAVDIASGYVAPEQEAELLPNGVRSAPPEEVEARLRPADLVDLPEIRQAEVSFLALHGGIGEDGSLQALLELARIPYTGTGPLGSGIAMDKDLSKRLLRDAGVGTLPWLLVKVPELDIDPARVAREVGFPCIVKPSKQGSSVGLTVVQDEGGVSAAVHEAARYDDEILVERFAKARELTVGVLGDQALPPVEIRPKSGLYDYKSKYTAGMTEYLCPAPLPEDTVTRVQQAALAAFAALKLRGYSRIDFLLTEDDLYCLEANTLPGMTGTSLYPKAAAAAGMEFGEVCERILHLAVAAHGSAVQPA